MEMKNFYKVFPFFVLFMLLSPILVSAQYDSTTTYIWNKIFGFKTEWLSQPRELITNVIIPSAAVFMIFLGIMRTIGISRGMGSGVEYGIATVVMLAMLFTGALGYANTIALLILGQFAFWGFFGVFLIAGAIYFYGVTRRARAQNIVDRTYLGGVQTLETQIKNLEKAKLDFEKKAFAAARRGDTDGERRWEEKAADSEYRMKKAVESLERINRAYKAMP